MTSPFLFYVKRVTKCGYSLEDAAQLAESTQILMNVSEFTDISTATDSLISSIQAFKYTAEESMDVVDILNTIGNNYAISTADLAQSLTKSSGSLVAANGTLEEAVALTATANTIIQDADVVGTALKTVAMRLRGTDTKTMEEEGLETDGAVTSKSKLQSKVKSLSGVDILTDTGAYKSTYQILSEIADVWKDINDMDQAALLELLAGKRAGSVMSAILQNPKTLKDAFESANNAAGSALAENEKYLDSIQGRIDLFNNAVQTMWNNALDSDVVKFFVDVGTALVKFVDKLGLIPSILLAIGSFKGLKAVFKGFDILEFIKSISDLTMGTEVFDATTRKATASLLEEKIQLGLSNNALISTLATKYLTIEAEKALKIAKDNLTLAEMGLLDGVATTADVQAAQAAVEAASVPVDVTKIGTTELLSAAFKGLALSIWSAVKAIVAFLFTNPVGWGILAVGVIAGVVAGISAATKSTEELAEELSDLKTELSNVKSEIDSLNSELETTQDRMAELLAMDSLSFTEQEELDNLKKTNDELQREIDLLKLKEKQKQKETAKTFVETIETDLEDDYEYTSSGKRTWLDKWIDAMLSMSGSHSANSGISEKDYIDQQIQKYQEYQDEISNLQQQLIDADGEDTKNGKKIAKKLEEKQKQASEIEEYINGKITEWTEYADGVDYIENPTTQAEQDVNDWLDYYNNIQDKWAIVSGGSNAQSNAITRILNKDEFSKTKKEIDELVQQINDGVNPNVVNSKIQSIINGNERLKNSFESVGIAVKDVADSFTMSSSSFDNSVEGIVTQYKQGVGVLQHFKSVQNGFSTTNSNGEIEIIQWEDLFDWDEETQTATAKSEEISKVLKGTSEDVRKEFGNLVEDIAEGKKTFSQAITSFSLSGLIAVSKEIETQFEELNKSIFKGLDEDVSGFIDTFDELSKTLENVASSMDLVHTAQQQMNSSGRISVKTALELIESTDDWQKILTITNGTITLNTNAEEILVQSKLNTIKANIDEALSQAQLQLAALDGAEAVLVSAEASDVTTDAYRTYTDAMNSYSASIAGFGAALDALINGQFGSVLSSFKNAYNSAKTVQNNQTEVKSTELKQKIADLQAQKKLLENVDTVEDFKNNYDYDKTPGDKYDDDSDEDAFQKAMSYWENRIAANQARYEQVQNEIDILEKQGKRAGADYYQEQIKLEKERLNLLEQQKAEAQKFLGTFKEGSDDWWNAAKQLNDIEGTIDDVTASILDLSDAIAQIYWDTFDKSHERFSDLIGQLETVRELLSVDEDNLFNDEGEWTSKGVAVLGAYIQELEIYKNALEDVNKELQAFQKPYKGNEGYFKEAFSIDSEQEYYEKRKELLDKQQDYSKSISDAQQSIVGMYEKQIDAVEEYTSKLKDSYNDYIDSVKEALDAERDLFNFKKNIEKQTKDIAELERKIAALSGSDNKSDIAERRKLQKELFDAKEGLSDTYYDHAKSAQNEALDKENEAYAKSLENYTEKLRETLDQAQLNMEQFMQNVTASVMLNAETVRTEYTNTGIDIDVALTTPWDNAIAAMQDYEVDGLSQMNAWLSDDGYFGKFLSTATYDLTTPWGVGASAAKQFSSDVSGAMKQVVAAVQSNVTNATNALNGLSGKISNVYKQILDTEAKADDVAEKVKEQKEKKEQEEKKKTNNNSVYMQAYTTKESVPTVYALGLSKDGYGAEIVTINGQKWLHRVTSTNNGQSSKYYKVSDLSVYTDSNGNKMYSSKGAKITAYRKYATGTTGTKKDQWAITDEPQYGDELVLVPNAAGNLSFMRKGTSVVPADITANLVEWGKLNPNMMSITNPSAGVNVISNAINKPELNFTFDSLVHVDHCDEGTLKDLEKMVDSKINDFTRRLNYSIKKFS